MSDFISLFSSDCWQPGACIVILCKSNLLRRYINSKNKHNRKFRSWTKKKIRENGEDLVLPKFCQTKEVKQIHMEKKMWVETEEENAGTWGFKRRISSWVISRKHSWECTENKWSSWFNLLALQKWKTIIPHLKCPRLRITLMVLILNPT